jgi:hypothetical protein
MFTPLNDTQLKDFINKNYNYPKTPYDLFVNRLKYTNRYNNNNNNSNNTINYFTIENLIISDLIHVELITRPIKKLNKKFLYWIEIDQIHREYTLFTNNTSSDKEISSYIGNNKDIHNLLIHGRGRITYKNKQLRKLMNDEYVQFINREFLYEYTDNKDQAISIITSIKKNISYESFIFMINRIKGSSDTTITTIDITDTQDENIIVNSNITYSIRIDSPSRIFSCVQNVDSIECEYIIKERLKTQDSDIMLLYCKYIYYFYHAVIPIDAYYRLGNYDNQYELITYNNLNEYKSKYNIPIIDDHSTNKPVELSRSNFILTKSYNEFIAPYYFYGNFRHIFYGNKIIQSIYNLPSIKNNFHKFNQFNDLIASKDQSNKPFKIHIKYDEFYIHILYKLYTNTEFLENHLFNYEIDISPYLEYEEQYNRKHPNYYSNLLRERKINNYVKESLVNREFNLLSSDDDENKEDNEDDNEYENENQNDDNSNTIYINMDSQYNNEVNKLLDIIEDNDDDDDDDNQSIINNTITNTLTYTKEETLLLKLNYYKEDTLKRINEKRELLDREKEYEESLLDSNIITPTIVVDNINENNNIVTSTSIINNNNYIEILSSSEDKESDEDDITFLGTITTTKNPIKKRKLTDTNVINILLSSDDDDEDDEDEINNNYTKPISINSNPIITTTTTTTIKNITSIKKKNSKPSYELPKDTDWIPIIRRHHKKK